MGQWEQVTEQQNAAYGRECDALDTRCFTEGFLGASNIRSVPIVYLPDLYDYSCMQGVELLWNKNGKFNVNRSF